MQLNRRQKILFSRWLSSFFAPLHELVFSDWLPRYGAVLSLAKGEKCLSICTRHVAKPATSRGYTACCFILFFVGFTANGFVLQLLPALYFSNGIMPKRKCFCSDCDGKYRSWNTVKRHRTLHRTGKLWLVAFLILNWKT